MKPLIPIAELNDHIELPQTTCLIPMMLLPIVETN